MTKEFGQPLTPVLGPKHVDSLDSTGVDWALCEKHRLTFWDRQRRSLRVAHEDIDACTEALPERGKLASQRKFL